MLVLSLLYLTLALFHGVICQNILLVALAYPGDVRTFLSVGAILSQKGYNVTLVAPEYVIHDGMNYSMFSVVTIQSCALQGQLKPGWNEGLIQSILEGSWIRRIAYLYEDHVALEDTCTHMLQDRGLIKELETRQFDFSLVGFPICSAYLPHLLSVPFAQIHANHDFSKWPARPCESIIPRKVSTLETILNVFLMITLELISAVKEKERTYLLKEKDLVSTQSLVLHSRASFILRSPLMDFPYSRNPGVIYTGHLAVPQPLELPRYLRDYVEDSPEGLVIVSFGSWVVIPEYLTRIFLEAFAGLPYRFIMKSDKENLEPLPNNVLLYPWIPVNELLSHRKTKLIISHGGINTLQEATYHGVPSVVIPFVYDQQYNGFAAEFRGYGKVLSLHNLNVATLRQTLYNAISNKTLSRTAKELSLIMKDQPSSADSLDQWLRVLMKYDKSPFDTEEPDYMICIDLYMIYIYSVIVIAVITICAFIILIFVYVFRIILPKVKND